MGGGCNQEFLGFYFSIIILNPGNSIPTTGGAINTSPHVSQYVSACLGSSLK